MRIRFVGRPGSQSRYGACALIGLLVAPFGWLFANDVLNVAQHERDTALIQAVDRADRAAVVAALARGADPNARTGPVRSFWRDLVWEWRHGRVRYYRRAGSALLDRAAERRSRSSFAPWRRGTRCSCMRC